MVRRGLFQCRRVSPPWEVYKGDREGVDLQSEPVCDPLYEPGCELAVEFDPVIAELLVLPLSLLSCSLWVLSLQVDEVVQFEGRVVGAESAHDGERSCGRGLAGIGHPNELHLMLSRVS